MTETPDLGEVDCGWVETSMRFPRSVAEAAGEALLVAPPPQSADVGSCPAGIIIGSERQLPGGWESAPYAHARRLAGDRLRWLVATRGSRGADAFAAGMVSALLHGDGA